MLKNYEGGVALIRSLFSGRDRWRARAAEISSGLRRRAEVVSCSITADATPLGWGTLLVAVLLACELLYWWYSLGMLGAHPIFPVDDAYISLQNALLLAGQRPEHFIGASPFSGMTSPAHTLLVSLLCRLLPPELSLSIAGLAGALAYACALIAICRRAGLGPVWVGLITYLGLASGYLPHHLANGLETSWALAAIAWCIYLVMEPQKYPGPILLALVALPLIRPELVLLSFLLAGYIASEVYKTKRNYRILFGAVVIVVGVVVVTARIYGYDPFPNTVYAKKFYFAEGCLPEKVKARYVLSALGIWFAPYGVLVIGLIGLMRDRLGVVLIAFAFIFLLTYFMNFPGALLHYEGRYMAVFVPMLALGWARLLPAEKLWAPFLLLCSSLFVCFSGVPAALEKATAGRAFTTNELMPLAEWMRANVPPEAKVMLHDVGMLGYSLDNPMVDLVGLKTMRAAELHKELTWPSCGRDRAESVKKLTQEEKPDYFVTLNAWDRFFELSPAAAQVSKLSLVWGHPDGYSVYAVSEQAASR